MLSKYIEYIKDNPEKYWFKRKMYGWGWTPATKEGWFVTVGFVALVLAGAFIFDIENKSDAHVLTRFIPYVLALTLLFLVIVYRKGEPPKWQWGFKRDKRQ